MLLKVMNHRITAIKVQKRRPQRVNIYLDGEFAFGLSRIVAGWLQVGQELSEEKITSLRNEDEREVAYQRALKFISYQMRTESQVRQKLSETGFPEDVIQSTMQRLNHSGLIDDNSYAKLWVENRSDLHPRSHRALAYELRRKGISDQVITQALKDAVPEETLAYKAGLKQSRKLRELEKPEFRRKLSGFLARRGFSYEIISRTIDRIWTENYGD